MLYALQATLDWDGCGAPPDGGDYTQVGDTHEAHFHCVFCNREANHGHINSQPHLVKLTHYLKMTGQTYNLPTTRPYSSSTLSVVMPTPNGFRCVPPPPPGGPMQGDDAPPPPPTQEMREIRMLEKKMDQQIQELTTMVRTLEAVVASLAAPRSEVSGSAWPPSSWHAATTSGSTTAAPSSGVWGPAWHADTTAVASRWEPGAHGEAASSAWRSSPSDAPENTFWNSSPSGWI